MAEVDALIVKIQGDLNGLKASLREGDGATKRFSTKAVSRMDRVTAATGKLSKALFSMKGLLAGAGGAALLAGTKRALEFGEEIKNTAVALNLTTDELQEFRFAATQVGLTTTDMDKALRKFTVTTGEAVTVGGEYKRSFDQLGISLTDGQGKVKATGTLFTELVSKLGQVDDVTKRAAIANRLLGRQIGSQFNILVEAGAENLAKLRDRAHEVGAVMDGDLATKARDAQDRLGALDLVVRTQLSSALIELAPIVEAGAKAMANFAKHAGSAARFARWAGEEVAAAVSGPAADDRVRIEDRIGDIDDALERLAKRQRGRNSTQLANLKAERESLQAMLDLLNAAESAPPPSREPQADGGPDPMAVSDEQIRALDRLRKAAMTAQDAVTKAQQTMLEKTAGNTQLSIAERIAALDKAQKAEVRLAESTLKQKLASAAAIEGEGVEAAALRDQTRASYYQAHQLRLNEIAREGEEQRAVIAGEGGSKMLETFQQIEAAARSSMLVGALGGIDTGDGGSDARLAALEERLMLEKQLEVNAYNDRKAELAKLQAVTAEEMLAKREAMLALTAEHEQNLTQLQADGARARQAIQDAEMQARYEAAKNVLDDLATLTATKSRKAFEVGKAAAIANATISTYQGAQDAFTSLAKIPIVGPALGAAAAAAAIAAGVARVQQISSTSFGQKGGPNAATPLGQSNQTLGGGTVPGAPQQQSSFFIEGLSPDALFSGQQVRRLLEVAGEQAGDGFNPVFGT